MDYRGKTIVKKDAGQNFQRNTGKTEKELTPAEQRKVNELRKRIVKKNRHNLMHTGINDTGCIEVTAARLGIRKSEHMEIR